MIDYSKLYRFIPAATLDKESMFDLDQYNSIVFPSSGPRSFVTMGFDQYLITMVQNKKVSTRSKWLVGGSSGALRICALISSILSGKDHTRIMHEHLTKMTYKKDCTPQSLTPMMNTLIEYCAPTHLLEQIVNHPYLHLCIFVIRIHPDFVDATDEQLEILFLTMFGINALTPQFNSHFYQSICFYSGPKPFFKSINGFLEYIPLTSDTLHDILRATTCLPIYSERVRQIGNLDGLFFDGGLCHCHLSVYTDRPSQLMLFVHDHNESNLKLNFFDTILPWRKIPEQYLQYTSQISPTDYFVEQIPEKRLPMGDDWFDDEYVRCPERRQHSWKQVYALSVRFWKKLYAQRYLY